MNNRTLPVYLCVSGKPVLVVGGGIVALRKVEWLLKSEVAVEVVSRKFCEQLSQLAEEHAATITLRREDYTSRNLADFLLAIAATDDPRVNHLVARDAAQAVIPINVVDCPEQCTFFVPATVARGPLKIAIGTDGNCPSLASRVRADLEQEYPEEYAEFVKALGVIRKQLTGSNLPGKTIRRVMNSLATNQTAELVWRMQPEMMSQRLQRMADQVLNQEENDHEQ